MTGSQRAEGWANTLTNLKIRDGIQYRAVAVSEEVFERYNYVVYVWRYDGLDWRVVYSLCESEAKMLMGLFKGDV